MSGVSANQPDVDVDIRALMIAIWEKRVRIVGLALAVAAAAFVVTSLMTPKYLGETRILIETGESVFTRPNTGNTNEQQPILDQEGVTSQVELIASTALLNQVAGEFRLADLEEFSGGSGFSIPFISSPPSAVSVEERVLKNMRERLKVFRVEGSRVIVIEFSSRDPQLAADIPNAIADAYVTFQQDAKLESNASATQWLEPEIRDLRERVKVAEARVAAYRSQNDIPIGQNNAALSTQQLSELSTELSRVRANYAAAEARARSVADALDAGRPIGSIPEVLSSQLIQRLSEREVQLRADIADLSATLLDNHPSIRSLRSQLSQLDAQIRSEARKVLESLRTEADTAKFRQEELISALNQMKVESARVGEKEVELRALEREATAQRELLESYLTRFREATSRKEANYLPVDARIFSRAIVPSEPYFPKVWVMTAAAFAASLLLSTIGILLAELFSGRAMRASSSPMIARPVGEVSMPPASSVASVAANEPGRRPDTEPDVEPDRPHPGLTADKVAAQLIERGASRAIFVSPEGDEAAACAVMTARLLSDAGLRTVLVDLSAGGAVSMPMLETRAMAGITDLLTSDASFSEIIHGDLYSDCHVVPTGTADPEEAMRSIERLPIILDALASAYDIVVLECGPTDAAGIKRLAGNSAEVLLSIIMPDDPDVLTAAADLLDGGYERLIMAAPVGGPEPKPPAEGRSAA